MHSEPSDSSRAFELLDIRIRKWIWEKNWSELHDVQERSIPIILDGQKDVIISAATGRGKTEAAFLPICSRLVSEPRPGLGALYISPLKALINDQFGRLELLCESLDLPVHRWHGDVSGSKKNEFLKNPSGLLLITPESLEAIFVNRGPQAALIFGGTQYVVIDEIHSFIGSERGAQLRSLMHRIELAIRRRVPRIGLSATLGDPAIAAEYMRFDSPETVALIESKTGGQELKIQLRGYQSRSPREKAQNDGGDESDAADNAIAKHLFRVLRGQDNLVFANSRKNVELYADKLRELAEREHLPQEFWPHHGNLSKDVRHDVERMLKEKGRPTTAVCTSTLELGIDIGDVSTVAQIGVPPSVASLRQRLGRSGRRGQPAVLRSYLTEWELGNTIALQDAIRSRLVTSIAMTNLLIRGWCEPPLFGAAHNSTLVQQVLSVIAQHGGVRAGEIWRALCGAGPFGVVGQKDFSELLRSIARHDLIVQSVDGTILLGELGERIVNHYSFYTAFQTSEEYQVIAGAKVLGTLPLTFGVCKGALIVFAGKRWRVSEVDDEAKALIVQAAPGGVPPLFDGGDLGQVGAEVRKEMKRVYENDDVPVYLNAVGQTLLDEGRATYSANGLASKSIVKHGDSVLLFPWSSDQAHNALALLLRSVGFDAGFDSVVVVVERTSESHVIMALKDISNRPHTEGHALAVIVDNLVNEKYDDYLPAALLQREFAEKHLDVIGAVECAKLLVVGL